MQERTDHRGKCRNRNIYSIIGMKNTADISRGKFSTYNSVTSFYINSLPVLGALLIALLAMSCLCCSMIPEYGSAHAVTTDLQVKSPGTFEENVGMIDLFTFYNEGHKKLDSYQRIAEISSGNIELASRQGERVLFGCANIHREKDWWANVNSIEAVCEAYSELEDESRETPVMTGMTVFDAGGKSVAELCLKILVSEIRVRSIRTDFRGMTYEGMPLTDVSVYLTNVNASCPLLPEEGMKPVRIINLEGLNQSDVEKMKHPDMLFRQVEREITDEIAYTDIRLRCYPNTCETESIGSPFTRLVIEGTLDGNRYFWPVEVGRHDAEGCGIERNRLYIYDITISGKGSEHPEICADRESFTARLRVLEWVEEEEQFIRF